MKMKSLVECLCESMEVNESSYDMLRFEFGDLPKKDETIKSIEDLASKNSIYAEKVDGGIKIKVNDSVKDKLDSIQDVLQQYIETVKDNDKADESQLKKIEDQINKLSDYIDSDDEDDDKDDKKDDDKKEDEEGE